MLISDKLNAAINEEIGREFEASNIYLNMAAYFDKLALKKLAAKFLAQADEERSHGLKFVKYVMDTGGTVAVPAVPAPKVDYKSVEEAIGVALEWELKITKCINELMTLAVAEKDYAAQDFLRWFVTEQVEEVSTMETLLQVVKAAGERNLIMVEAYLIHAA